ncbi:hypothetical protein [Nostoc favosum]|nr:hypothetical protein [Nostoc favosum]
MEHESAFVQQNLGYSDTTVLFPDLVYKENLKVVNSDRLKTG